MTERSEHAVYAVLLAILVTVLVWALGSTVFALFH
jgi:hypothetical protein